MIKFKDKPMYSGKLACRVASWFINDYLWKNLPGLEIRFNEYTPIMSGHAFYAEWVVGDNILSLFSKEQRIFVTCDIEFIVTNLCVNFGNSTKYVVDFKDKNPVGDKAMTRMKQECDCFIRMVKDNDR